MLIFPALPFASGLTTYGNFFANNAVGVTSAGTTPSINNASAGPLSGATSSIQSIKPSSMAVSFEPNVSLTNSTGFFQMVYSQKPINASFANGTGVPVVSTTECSM
jgi:hypothetical protein